MCGLKFAGILAQDKFDPYLMLVTHPIVRRKLGELIGQGKEAAQRALVETPELGKKIVDAIMTKRNAAVK